MNTQPLIGVSICAVVLLILGSLTNVIGYQSVKSNTVDDSPLFQKRTQRATNQQKNTLTSQYIGMGGGNLLQFPIRNDRTELIQKFIERIRTIDDSAFKRFVNEFVSYLNNNDKFYKNKNQVVCDLYRLRENSEKNKMPVVYINRQKIIQDTSIICQITSYTPFCDFLNLIVGILFVPFILLFIFGSFLSSFFIHTSCSTCACTGTKL
jgi:hypothetical protein